MTVGDRIKGRREQLGLTLEDVAKHLKVSKQAVFKYENNIVTNIPLDKIRLLAEVLETTIPDLVNHENGFHIKEDINGDLMALREQLRRQPGMRMLFNVSRGATEQDLLDAVRLIEGFKKRRSGEE